MKEIFEKNKKKILIISVIIILVVVAIIIVNQKLKYKIMDDEEKITKYEYYTLYKDNKMGIIDKTGKVLIEPTYDNIKIPNPSKPIFVCSYDYNDETQEYKTKVLNENSQEIFNGINEISAISLQGITSNMPYEKRVLRYKENEKYGIINLNGNKVTKPIYESIESVKYKEGYILAQKDGKYGVIDSYGKVVIENQYDAIEGDGFQKDDTYKYSGYIVCKDVDGKNVFGYVNNVGKTILKTEYSKIARIPFQDETQIYLIADNDKGTVVLKNEKNILNRQYQSIEYDKNINSLIVKEDNRFGIYSMDAKQILPNEYEKISINGIYILAQKDGKSFLYDKNGKEIENKGYKNVIPTSNENYYITIDSNSKYGVMDKDNKTIIDNQYPYIKYAFDNYFIISNASGKSGIIDINNKVIVEPIYDVLQNLDNTKVLEGKVMSTSITDIFSKNIEKVVSMQKSNTTVKEDYIKIYSKTDTKYLDLEGKEIPAKNALKSEVIPDKKDDKWGVIDRKENVVVDYKYDKITEFNEYGFAGIRQADKWGVINTSGEVVLEPTYKISDESIEPDFMGKYYKVNYGYGEVYYTDKIN